jgi:hypothetical protein
MNPQECLKVISTSITYYPPGSRNEEGLTVMNSVVFLQENLRETVNVFRAGGKLIVLQQWSGILFFLSSENNTPEEVLRFILQMTKDIAVFLFGPQFHVFLSSMNIVATLRDIFAKYVEKLFEIIKVDYKALAMVTDSDESSQRLAQHIVRCVAFGDASPIFVECILFNRHRLVGRFAKSCPLQAGDVFRISLLERIEFGACDMSDGSRVEVALPPMEKKIHLFIDGAPQQCYLSEVHFGATSPFVLIFVINAPKPSDDARRTVTNITDQFVTAMAQFAVDRTPLLPTFQITGMLCYLLINRTTGDYRESDRFEDKEEVEQTPLFEDKKEGEQPPLFERIRRKMVTCSIAALQAGYLSQIRNEMIFQYTWEMKFVSSKGQLLVPVEPFKKPRFEDGGISYTRIVSDLFGPENDVICYELMVVYLGVVSTKDVVDANRHLFDVLTRPPAL